VRILPPQFLLQDLARRILRQTVDEEDRLRTLVGRQVLRCADCLQTFTAPFEASETEMTDFDRLFAEALKGGPTLIAARIDHKPAVGATDRDPVQIRERFMRGIGVRD
jgi:hypothetical protein